MQDNDIVFFNLHRRYVNFSPSYGGFMGVYLLAAYLNENGYDAQGYAGQLMEGKKLIDVLCSEQHVSMIGLYCDFENVTETCSISSYIKDTYHLPVIIGGPQATVLSKEFYLSSKCDAVVRYEGEETVLELVDCFLDGTIDISQIKGISYLADDKVQVNDDREPINNLDALPDIKITDYLDPSRYDKSLAIMTGRGCPFHCAFCHEGHHTKKVRFRSVERVLNEIKCYIAHQEGKRDIHVMFVDDTFTLLPDRVKEICAGLNELRQAHDIRWFCEGHIHTLYMHPEMIEYIAAAGCYRIQLGIEAGTQEILDAYRKGSTLKEIFTVVQKCRDAGIREIFSNIIVGGANFTKEIYLSDVEFAKKLIMEGAGTVEIGIVSYWPLPETSITDNPHQYGIEIVDADFVTSVGDFPQVEVGGLNVLEIMHLVKSFSAEIDALMRDMLRHNKIPRNRILSWLDNYSFKSGKWWNVFISMPEIYAFYQMLSLGEAVTSDYFDAVSIMNAHPMRVIPLNEYMEVDEQGIGHLLGVSIGNGIPLDTLIFATGKLSVSDIVSRLMGKSKYSAYSVEAIRREVLEALRYLEENHLVVYSVL